MIYGKYINLHKTIKINAMPWWNFADFFFSTAYYTEKQDDVEN